MKNLASLVKEKIDLIKKSEQLKKPQPFTNVYLESIKFAERVAVHAEIGEFPYSLFIERAPNQTQEEFNYIKANHKTITFPIWSRFIGVLNRIWADQNWSITWPENSDEIKEYFDKGIPKYENYEYYFKNVVTPLKQRDANAVLAIKPYDIPVKLNENGDPLLNGDGDVIVDDTQQIKPFPVVFNSQNVLDYEEGRHALVMLEEKSYVQFGNGKEKSGIILEFYDENNIWRIVQKGRKSDYQFDYFLYWNHNLGYLPAWKLKGIPLLRGEDILYQTHFMCAIESLDSALLDNSYLMAIKAGAAFPHKWEYVDECSYEGCVDGLIFGKEGRPHKCPSCNGTGNSKPSVMGVYQIKMPTRENDSTKDVALPPFGWESPKFEPMEFLRKEIELHKNEALSILNLQNSTTNAQGSDTALGKIIDREELFSFILSISNQLFELYEKSMKAIIDMRYLNNNNMPSISAPKNFSIRNENDITQEIAAAKTSNAPDIAIRALLVEYMNIRFNSDVNTTKIVDLVFAADRLITLSNIEIANKVLSGTVAKWEDILHTSIYLFIKEASSESVNFFDLDLQAQITILKEKALLKVEEISPKTDSTQSILEASASSGV